MGSQLMPSSVISEAIASSKLQLSHVHDFEVCLSPLDEFFYSAFFVAKVILTRSGRSDPDYVVRYVNFSKYHSTILRNVEV
jgi:hypothetical protein